MCTNSRDWIFLGIDFIFWSAMTGARQSDVFNNQLGIKQFKSVHLFYKLSSCSENAQAQTHWSEAIKMWSVQLFYNSNRSVTNSPYLFTFLLFTPIVKFPYWYLKPFCNFSILWSSLIEIDPHEEFPTLGGLHLVLISIWCELQVGNTSTYCPKYFSLHGEL